MTTHKKCGFCRKTFEACDGRPAYCGKSCRDKARKKQLERYKPKKNRTPSHVTTALDRFEATYGTRIPAEVPEALTDWCVMLQEAAQ